MSDNKIPYILLDENFHVVYVHEKIKEEYSGLLLPDFFRNLLSEYQPEDFEIPVELDAGIINSRDVKLVFYKKEGGIVCCPVKTKVYGDRRQRNIHYRLREPISSIFAIMPVIIDNINKDDGDKAVLNLETVNIQSYKLLKNVNNMALASKILAGDLPNADDLSLTSLIDNIMMAVKMVERNVKINCTLDEKAFVRANKGLMTTALMNLVANSINFKGDDVPVININLKNDGDNVVFSYSDNSIGVKNENIQNIFKPYYSVDPYSDGANEPSLGLGLFIVKNAFEAAGGKIMTSSVFGKGIKYIVTMPAVADNGRILESNSSEFLLNRYSELFVQLCDSCQLPMLG